MTWVLVFLLHALLGCVFGTRWRAIALLLPVIGAVIEAAVVSVLLGLSPVLGIAFAGGLVVSLEAGYLAGAHIAMRFLRTGKAKAGKLAETARPLTGKPK